MKLSLLVCTFSLIGTMAFSQNSIKGIWQPEGKKAIFKIYEENGKFYGQLIGSDNLDENKKIKEKQKIVLLRDLQKESDTEYCCGTFIAPEKKKKLTASAILKNEDTLVLKIKKGWFGKSIIWKRVNKKKNLK
jgi:uncharacterized protein (DUF2147 family)